MSCDDTAVCSLCGKPIGAAGDHQICCLACGHIFGYSCINRLFETSNSCPRCGKGIRLKDIRLLFWGAAVPVIGAKVTGLRESNHRLERDITCLETEIERLRARLATEREHLACARLSGRPREVEKVTRHTVAAPSIVCERRLTGGFRVCSIGAGFAVSVKSRDGFGIEVLPLGALGEPSFLEVHSMRICDVTALGSRGVVVTASQDKSLAEISIETMSVRERHPMDVGLWCCAAIDDWVVAAGGDRGRLVIFDTRAGQTVARREAGGPPVFAVARLGDGLIMGMNPRESFLFDLRKGACVASLQDDVGGGTAITGIRGSDVYTVIAHNEACFCTFSHAFRFTAFATVPVGRMDMISHSAMDIVDGAVYAAVPSTAPGGFGIHVMSQPTTDIWQRYRGRWQGHENNAPAVGLAMTHDAGALLVAAVHPDRLTVYEVPTQ